MREFKNLSVALIIALIAALFFVVVWAFNMMSDHTAKINTLWMATGSTAEILSTAEKERSDLKSSILDLNQTLKESQHNKKTNFVAIFDALKSMEGVLKKSDSSYNLSAKFVPEKKKRYGYSDSEDDSDDSDSEIEAELMRRRKQKKRQK